MQYMYTVYTLKATINIDNILCTCISHCICFSSVRVVARVCVGYKPLSLYTFFACHNSLTNCSINIGFAAFTFSFYYSMYTTKEYHGRRVPVPICYLFPGRR